MTPCSSCRARTKSPISGPSTRSIGRCSGADDMDLDVARAQRRRGLQPDKARADHDRAARAFGRVDDGAAIGERAQHVDMRLVGARDRQPHRLGAGRQQQPVVGNGVAAGDDDVARASASIAGDLGVEPQVDAGFGVEVVRPQRQPVLRRAAGEIVLRQVGPVDRRRGIVAQHHDAAAIILPPQHLGRGKARRATADDDDPAGRIGRRLRRAASAARAFRRTKMRPSSLLDLPDRERIERRRARRLAGAQIEAGVMPGTADALADHEAFGERPVVMAAMRADREDLRARAHQQHFLVADMAEQGLARRIRTSATPLRQIGTGGRSLLIGHVFLRCDCPFCAHAAIPRNSWRVSGLSRKQPSMRLVTRSVSGLCTPRVVMQ